MEKLSYRALILKALKLDHNEKIIIGKSVENRNIYALHFGKKIGKQILISCAIHAREYISTLLLTHLLKDNVSSMGIWFIPIANPDGVKIVLEGKGKFYTDKPNQNLKLLKANARGVDLNVNFDANWGNGRQNTNTPGLYNFIGPNACSEPETQALTEFAKQLMPSLSLCFHSKGEVVYYSNLICKAKRKNYKKIAKILAKQINYKRKLSKNSFGGYADYTNLNLGIPSYTIEIGSNKERHPITTDELPLLMQNFNHFWKSLNDISIRL